MINTQFTKEKMANTEFQHKFFYTLIRDCYEFQANNTTCADCLTFGSSFSSRIKRQVKDKALLFARRNGFVRRHFVIEKAIDRLIRILENIDTLEKFYYSLRDDHSKQLLIDLLRFRVLGAQHVKLPSNNDEYWGKYSSVDKRFMIEQHTIKTWNNWYLNRYRLQGIDGPLDFHAHPVGVLNTFLLEQYAYKKGSRTVQVQKGDIVIEAGSGWGEVALYFADRVGGLGKVYCSEFVEDNLRILRENLDLNQQLATRIKIIPKAIWDKSGEVVSYCANGPATSLVIKQGSERQQRPLQASTLSIDDFVKEEGIKKVDYIKMDIEGSELKALQGAEETMRTYKPKLAIALYHREDDFIVIPSYLDKLGLGYEFFLDHFTIHRWETVLFASPGAD